MNESDEVHVIGKKCFVCQRKRCCIIVKIIINELGVAVKSQNRMTFCRNKECHRYQENPPVGWIFESLETYEREKIKIQNSWQPRKYTRRKPLAKDQGDEGSGVDAEGAEVRTVEDVRAAGLSKRYAWNGGSGVGIEKSRTVGKAVEDASDFQDGDADIDILE